MSTEYKVKVDDAQSFEFTKDNISQFDSVLTESDKFHILHQNKSYQAEIIRSQFNRKSYSVKVNNNTYEVVISNALDQLIESMGFEKGRSKHVNSIKAPMPGLILEISVAVGQTVKLNDNLIILSAMKMENSFLSPRDGVIKSIAVKVGDAVDKGQLMIEFE